MDHYRTLGVDKRASKEKIASAYRKLALKYHPDKNSDPGAREKFEAVNNAYKILKDDRQRHSYDEFTPSGSSHQSHHQSRSKQYSDSFFKGEGNKTNQAHEYEELLEKIRKHHADMLDKANSDLRRSTGRSDKKRPKTSSKTFAGMPHLGDDEYEEEVLQRLKSVAACR